MLSTLSLDLTMDKVFLSIIRKIVSMQKISIELGNTQEKLIPIIVPN